MKKLLTGLVAGLVAILSVSTFAGCGSVKYPVEDGKFTIVTNCPFGKYEYIGDDGKIYGIDIEIAGMFAKEQGLELVVKNIDFDAIFDQVDDGYADAGMAGITITEKRKKIYDFTNTYCKASQKLIVAKNNTDFDGKTTVEEVENVLKGLSGKKVGFQTGTTGGMYIVGDADFDFDGFSNIEGKNYDTAALAVDDLKNGNIYAVVVDEGPANSLVSVNSNDVKVIDVKLTDEDYAFVLKKGNKKLVKLFNAFLDKIKANGEYNKIEQKYYQGVGDKVGYNVFTD